MTNKMGSVRTLLYALLISKKHLTLSQEIYYGKKKLSKIGVNDKILSLLKHYIKSSNAQ